MFGESIGAIAFDFPELERALSLGIRSLISRKGAELGNVLPILYQ